MNRRETWTMLAVIGLFLLTTILSFSGDPESATLSQPLDGQPLGVRANSVAVIPLYGMVHSNVDDIWGDTGIESVMDMLEVAEKNKNIRAVVLRINSPGGTVGSSQELYHRILKFKQNTGKPVVASIVDVGASGAYWVALAADYIMANPGSMVGSMGVIMQSPDLTGVPKKYALDMRTYKSGQMKDMLNPWRATTEKERRVTQRLLDNVHRQFVDTIVDSRRMTRKRAKSLADGRVYTGEQAVKVNLIDQIGGLDESVRAAAVRAGLRDEPKVIRLHRANWRKLIRGLRGEFFPSAQSLLQNLSTATPQIW